MNKLCLIAVSVLLFSSLLLPQEKSSIQFSGGVVAPMSSFSGLTGTLQYNYNLNPRFNLFVSANYSAWDKRYFTIYEENHLPTEYKTAYPESDHSMSRIMAGIRYIVVEPAQFKLFVEGGIGYSYLKYKGYVIRQITNPDGTNELLYSNGSNESDNLFNISSGIGFIHQITSRWDILFEYKVNSYLNAHYYGLFSNRGMFSEFNGGFNYRI